MTTKDNNPTAKNLGNLTRVEPRDIRKDEANDFTPWLSQEENLAILGNAIGLKLEFEASEKNVGVFRADILCKNKSPDGWVVIENQLERTNHQHLGQLLTYAAGLKADTIVWVACKFTEEHRAALDWLNEISNNRFNFFGLEIELWRIGDSNPAPKFNVIGKPNNWSRTVSDMANQIDRGNLSEEKLLQLDYWTVLRERLTERNSILKPRKPEPKSWTSFALGKPVFALRASIYGVTNIVVGVRFYNPDAEAHFRLLEETKESVENEFGSPLEWTAAPEYSEYKIELRKDDVDTTRQNNWPQQHEWIIEQLEDLHRVFLPRVMKLDAADYQYSDDR